MTGVEAQMENRNSRVWSWSYEWVMICYDWVFDGFCIIGLCGRLELEPSCIPGSPRLQSDPGLFTSTKFSAFQMFQEFRLGYGCYGRIWLLKWPWHTPARALGLLRANQLQVCCEWHRRKPSRYKTAQSSEVSVDQSVSVMCRSEEATSRDQYARAFRDVADVAAKSALLNWRVGRSGRSLHCGTQQNKTETTEKNWQESVQNQESHRKSQGLRDAEIIWNRFLSAGHTLRRPVLQQNLATAESKQHPERNGTTATEKRGSSYNETWPDLKPRTEWQWPCPSSGRRASKRSEISLAPSEHGCCMLPGNNWPLLTGWGQVEPTFTPRHAAIQRSQRSPRQATPIVGIGAGTQKNHRHLWW